MLRLAVARAALVMGLIGAAAGVAGCGGGGGGTLAGLLSSEAASDAPAAPAVETVKLEELMVAGPLGDKALGKENAPVTVIEYASLTCPVCASFHKNTFPAFKKAYIDTGKVRYIWREFPIGRASAAAAIAVRCAPDKSYFRLNEKFLANQPAWVAQEVKTDEIYNIVKESGLKRAAFDACYANQKINDDLVVVKNRGRALGVNATPTFFINGQRVRGGLSLEEMAKVIDPILAAPKPQQQALAPAGRT
ncbi:MAG: DsbA family protein [Hyphomicrobiales bacterium]|nr:DsbA family protein [Hyphomicrobiales bacterium]